MPDVISFQDAIRATEGDDKALLIGNGFSAQYFNYANLLAEAQLEEGSSIKALFDQLGTVDFEAVIRALEDATIVERAYGNAAHATELEADAQKVREALVTAVNATHPAHRDDLIFQYESAAVFLKHFGKGQVFTLNYDLLLYWVNLEKGLLTDGFGLGDYLDEGRFKGPFLEGAYCNIFNLHGGLHLFQNEIGEVFKALNHGDGVIANITYEHEHRPHRLQGLELLHHAARRRRRLWRLPGAADLPDLPEDGGRIRQAALQPRCGIPEGTTGPA
jgi:hypothetical protein